MAGIVGMPQNLRSELVKNLTGESVPLAYYSHGTTSIYSDANWGKVYDEGYFANEALVAIGGVQCLEDLFRQLSKSGTTFDSAFKSVYGVNQDSLMAILQKYLDSVRNGSPMSLKELQDAFATAKS